MKIIRGIERREAEKLLEPFGFEPIPGTRFWNHGQTKRSVSMPASKSGNLTRGNLETLLAHAEYAEGLTHAQQKIIKRIRQVMTQK
jgi:hypothetical protein